MNIKNTYPTPPKQKIKRNKLIKILRWPMIFAAIACPIINFILGGRWWSVVVLMGMYSLWSLVLSPDLVEYNRLSQFIKSVIYAIILMVLIDYFLAPGWAAEVVPIVGFGSLIVAAILLFTDLEQQKQNLRPLLIFIVICIVGSAVGLSVELKVSLWPLAVLGAVAVAVLIACVIVLRTELIRELKRRFHTK